MQYDLDPAPFTVLALDAKGYSRRTGPVHVELREGIRRIMDQACRRAHIDASTVSIQDTGDGLLALIPASVPKPVVVADLGRELKIAVSAFNTTKNGVGRLRLRAAMHHGDGILDGTGFAGQAAVVAVHLVDSPPVRTALDDVPQADLALIVSAELYRDTVAEGYRGLEPAHFSEVGVRTPKLTTTAWVRLYGFETSWRPRSPRSSEGAASPAESACRGRAPNSGVADDPTTLARADDAGRDDQELARLIMLARHPSGHPGEARRVYEETREQIAARNGGIEPRPEPRKLDQRILDQDPAIGGQDGASMQDTRIPVGEAESTAKTTTAQTGAASAEKNAARDDEKHRGHRPSEDRPPAPGVVFNEAVDAGIVNLGFNYGTQIVHR